MFYFILHIGILLLLFISAAFFSASETALISLSRMRIKKLISELPKKARGLKLWLEDPNKLLTTLLIGINTVAILSSALATSMAIKIAELNIVSRGAAISISTVCVTIIVIIFGEVSPKIFAIHNAEKLVIFSIMPLYYIDKMLSPLTKLFVIIGGIVVGKSGEKKLPVLTIDDMKTMISVGHETGIFGTETKQMMHSILKFSQITAKSIMTPRNKIEMVNFDTEREKFVDLIVETGHSRVPIYKDNSDNVIGIIYVHDLLDMWRGGAVFTVDDLLRQVIFVDEEKKVNELMRQFKKGETHLVVVKNPEGKILGLVTIEDIIEEVFGEILDEYDVADLFKE